MVAAVKWVYQLFATRPLVRVTAQAVVSLGMIALLVWAAQTSNLMESLGQLRPGTIGLAAALGLVQIGLASCRWQIMLRQVGIREPLGRLGELYLIGQFFSLFLPTSTGGDAVRVYEVARRSGRTVETLVATLQERLLGLGSALLIGLAATLYYLPLLPAELRFWALVLQLLGAASLVVVVYPVPLIRTIRHLASTYGNHPRWRRLTQGSLADRVSSLARPIADLPALPLGQLVLLLTVALSGTLIGVSMYCTVGEGLGIQAGFLAFCLVVPLVWIVRMAPVSLNGIGVGEGAFVFLMGLFAVPRGQALALALAMLGLQTALALLGGLLVVLRMLRKGRQSLVRTDSAHGVGEVAPHRRAA